MHYKIAKLCCLLSVLTLREQHLSLYKGLKKPTQVSCSSSLALYLMSAHSVVCSESTASVVSHRMEKWYLT